MFLFFNHDCFILVIVYFIYAYCKIFIFFNYYYDYRIYPSKLIWRLILFVLAAMTIAIKDIPYPTELNILTFILAENNPPLIFLIGIYLVLSINWYAEFLCVTPLDVIRSWILSKWTAWYEYGIIYCNLLFNISAFVVLSILHNELDILAIISIIYIFLPLIVLILLNDRY